ncbi:TPA: YdiH family protein [Kluyvera georgiana]|nr:YdiH family protein [Kluyvera georgiana]HED1419792.1 YdiH family protein [Kluyvera georgiana]
MDTMFTPAQLAIEYLRRETTSLTPAQYLKRLKQLELEFADLMALSSIELKEEIDFAWRLGLH